MIDLLVHEGPAGNMLSGGTYWGLKTSRYPGAHFLDNNHLGSNLFNLDMKKSTKAKKYGSSVSLILLLKSSDFQELSLSLTRQANLNLKLPYL